MDQHYLKGISYHLDANRYAFDPETCNYSWKPKSFGMTHEAGVDKPQLEYYLNPKFLKRLGKGSQPLYTTNHRGCEIVAHNNPKTSTTTVSLFKETQPGKPTTLSLEKLTAIALHHAGTTSISSEQPYGFLSFFIKRLNLYSTETNQIQLLDSWRTQHVFKRFAFLTKQTILGLTTDGEIYTIALNESGNRIQNLYQQRLYNTDGEPIFIADFAHDAINPGTLILVGGINKRILIPPTPDTSESIKNSFRNNIEYDPQFYYVDLHQSYNPNKIKMINISKLFVNPCRYDVRAQKDNTSSMQGIEKIWLHDGILGVVYGKGVNVEDCEKAWHWPENDHGPWEVIKDGCLQKMVIGKFEYLPAN